MKRILIQLLLVINSVFVYGQNMTMPYSVYGPGDLERSNYDRSTGMGGAGIANQSQFYVLQKNPAAMAALVRSFYQVDFAAMGKIVTYKGSPIDAENSNNKDFWIKRLALSAKITNRWASGIGFQPFSQVNYQFSGTGSITGTTGTYQALYEGSGGLTEYYWNNAVQLTKRLSLGVKSSIIAGSINGTETLLADGLNNTLATTVQDYFANARFRFGAQYVLPVSKNWNLSLGGIYSPQTKLTAERSLTVSDGGVDIVSNEFIANYTRYIPRTWGGGLTAKYKERLTYSVDFEHSDWSAHLFRDKGWQMKSSNKISAGTEWAKRIYSGNQWMEKRFFQVGAWYDQGSLQVSNQPISEWAVSAGMGGVLSRNLLYTVALEVGRRGTTRNNLIRENFGQISFSISYRDFLFSKGRQWD